MNEKPAFIPIIRQFIRQVDEAGDLKVGSYPKTYSGLKLKVSLGTSKPSRMPRLTFHSDEQHDAKGVYPGFLYFKEQSLLVLSYGITDVIRTSLRWNFPPNVQTVSSYFLINGFGTPEKYGNSLVYKVYSPISEIDPEVIERDLQEILSEYKQMVKFPAMLNEPESLPLEKRNKPFDLSRTAEIKSTGLLLSRDMLYRYAISLLAKPFVILSGLSGSGKTRMALTFAKWLSSDDTQVKVVCVGADWNNREYLLGYPNALDNGKYIKPENGVLDFLIQAIANPTKPYFLILDEMNLSHVERYFADFLSTMESGETIALHPDTDDWKNCDVPCEIKLPINLFITGTINVDETTYMFSPKVLDRANVIEFRISDNEMKEFLAHCTSLNHGKANYLAADMGHSFVQLARLEELPGKEKCNQILLSFFQHLKTVGAEFGYRTAAEIYRFIAISDKLSTGWDDDKLIDIAVMQKMLPRLHGSRKKIQPILTALWQLCLKPGTGNLLIEADDIFIDQRFRYPLAAEKIRQMFRNVRDNGFTSYAEA